ncbi:YoaK family protein [Oscillospiraceae bacterium 50-58]
MIGMTSMYNSNTPAGERLFPVALLTLSGGLQDAYTYFCRGHVFANAQTGNIVLLGQSLFSGSLSQAGRYLLPLLAFALGVAAAEYVRTRPNRRLGWQQQVLLWEIALLAAVGFLPPSMDLAANALVSFSCAMQVQSFRRVEGFAFASTMCIGNLRGGTDALCAFLRTKDRQERKKAGLYFTVILLFALGAGAGSLILTPLGLRAIWLSCALLALSFVLLF